VPEASAGFESLDLKAVIIHIVLLAVCSGETKHESGRTNVNWFTGF
jgi:hypothetical protein